MSSSGRAFETRLNVLLGRLLSGELGVRAMSEYFSRRDRPDVIVYVNGVRVVLEGSYSKADAERDVRQRIEEGLGDMGLALFYRDAFPQDLTDAELEERLKASKFEVRIIVPEDISGTLIAYLKNREKEPRWVTGWIEVSLQNLVSIMNEALQFIISEEDIKQSVTKIEEKVKDFVERAKSVDPNKQLAKSLYELFYRLYGLSVGDYREIDELIYAKAALIIFLSATFYQSVRAELGLPGLSELCKRHGYRLGLKKAFEEIWKIDYRPIYGLALQVVNTLPDALSLGLKELVDLAEESSSKRNLLRKDFSGKIYHKIVGDWAVRKNFATYFTTVPAAYLLAYLAVFTRSGVFIDYRKVAVGDLACGSGTLLTAAYSALKDLYIDSMLKRGSKIDLRRFNKEMLEESIWGIDALRYAVQIASTNLALQDPSTPVSYMNLFTVPLGEENSGVGQKNRKNILLGSLEFLRGRALPSIAMYFAQEPLKFLESAETASITGGEVPAELPEFDFIIMNPPFTRATGRGGKEKGGLFGFILDDKTRKDILQKYEKIRKQVQENLEELVDRDLIKMVSQLGIKRELFSIGQAGEGLLFLYLASKRVKEGGKIAFVLPKSLLTGTSWFLARNLLLKKFHIEHVVLSYDAKNGYNFSESTNLSEILMVARKRENPEDNEETTMTILIRKPSTSLEARALAFKIIEAGKNEYVKVNESEAFIYKFPRSVLLANLDNWGKLCAFVSPNLNILVNEILSGSLHGKKIPVNLLGNIVDIVGLAVRRGTFHEIFRQAEKGTPEAIPALIGGEEELRKKIAVKPNANVVCTNPKYLSTASKFLVPDRLWIDTTRALALYCDRPVVSNLFFGLRQRREVEVNENRLKALILWFNTTWGILSILANRTETRGRWIELTITKWKLQPVLDVTQLDEGTIDRLANVLDKFSNRELRRLPDQFTPCNIDPVRMGIDQGFLDAMGIKVEKEELEDLYRIVHENLETWVSD